MKLPICCPQARPYAFMHANAWRPARPAPNLGAGKEMSAMRQSIACCDLLWLHLRQQPSSFAAPSYLDNLGWPAALSLLTGLLPLLVQPAAWRLMLGVLPCLLGTPGCSDDAGHPWWRQGAALAPPCAVPCPHATKQGCPSSSLLPGAGAGGHGEATTPAHKPLVAVYASSKFCCLAA